VSSGFVGDAAEDAYAMSHNSTLQHLTASTHALLLDRPTIFTRRRCTSPQFIGQPQRQRGLSVCRCYMTPADWCLNRQ